MTYFRRGKGLRTRLPDDMKSDAFKKHYLLALSQSDHEYVANMKPTPIENRKQKTEYSLTEAVRRTKTRARKKNLDHNINKNFLLNLAEDQDFKCSVTGLEFYKENNIDCRVSPYAPSIDRIDSKKGYTVDNVRLVVFAFNAMVLDWGDDVFETIARSYLYKKRTNNARTLFQNPEPSKKPFKNNDL